VEKEEKEERDKSEKEEDDIENGGEGRDKRRRRRRRRRRSRRGGGGQEEGKTVRTQNLSMNDRVYLEDDTLILSQCELFELGDPRVRIFEFEEHELIV